MESFWPPMPDMSSQVDQLLTIYWHSQSADAPSISFMTDAMKRFEVEVFKQAGVQIFARHLSNKDGNAINRLIEEYSVEADDEHPISRLVSLIVEDVPDLWRLLVYCPHATALREMARRQMKQRVLPWGVALGRYAFVFAHRIEQVVWHEALHTFGAEECYDPNHPREPFSACHDANCLMQYEPTLVNCGDGFPICSRVFEKIQSGLAR